MGVIEKYFWDRNYFRVISMFMVFKVMVQNGYVNFVCAGGGGGGGYA